MKTALLLALVLLTAGCDSVIYGRDQYGNINYPPPMDPATQMMILSTMRANQPQYPVGPAYQAPMPVNCSSYRVGNTVNTNCY